MWQRWLVSRSKLIKIHRQSHHAGTVIKNLDYSFLAFLKMLVLLCLLKWLFSFNITVFIMTDCEADSEGCLFSCSWHLIKPHLLDWGIEWNVWSLTLCLPLEKGELFASYTFYLWVHLSLSCCFLCRKYWWSQPSKTYTNIYKLKNSLTCKSKVNALSSNAIYFHWQLSKIKC